MRKLTQKEYLEDLQAGSCFIQACHGATLEELIAKTDALECDIKDYTVYRYTSVVKRSKDFVFTREDGTKSHRDFYGKNEYWTHKQILYHVNTTVNGRWHSDPEGTHTCIFINC